MRVVKPPSLQNFLNLAAEISLAMLLEQYSLNITCSFRSSEEGRGTKSSSVGGGKVAMREDEEEDGLVLKSAKESCTFLDKALVFLDRVPLLLDLEEEVFLEGGEIKWLFPDDEEDDDTADR